MDRAPAVLQGDVGAGARVIRWLEDEDPRGREHLARLYPHTGRAHLIGVTGPAGVGKSSVVDIIITAYRARGLKVGVVAVDPTSPFTGGAILGDRVRMQRHAADDGVFIRSMGARGQMGGLARASFDAMLVLDAMGYDVVLVETVGVGQDELEVVSLTHTTVLISAPGLGDEVQAIKAGLMEVGDVLVLNKADRDGAHQAMSQIELALHLREISAPDATWRPPLVAATATRGEGGEAIVDALQAHRAHLEDTGEFAAQAARRAYHVFVRVLGDVARARLLDEALIRADARALIDEVRARRLDPHAAAATLSAALRIGALEPLS